MSESSAPPPVPGGNNKRDLEEILITHKIRVEDGWVTYYSPNSRIPRHMKAEDFFERRPDLLPGTKLKNQQQLDEITVYGKKLNISLTDFYSVLRLLARDKRVGLALDAAELIAGIYQYLNDQQTPTDEVTESIADELNEAMQEIKDAEPSVKEEIAQAVQDVLEQESQFYDQKPLEEVLVTAQNLSLKTTPNWSQATITLSWPQVEPLVRASFARDPKTKMSIRELTQIVNETNTKPWQYNDYESYAKATAAVETHMGVLSSTSTSEALTIRNRLFTKEKARQEENKPRKDGKAGRAAALYRGTLMLINKTYGTLDEVQDFLNAFIDNIKHKGRPLSSFSFEEAMEILKSGDFTVDHEQVLIDLVSNEIEDQMWGRSSAAVRSALNEMGYWGPNPGSYLPSPPPNNP